MGTHATGSSASRHGEPGHRARAMTEELADIRRRVATKAQQCLQTWPRGSPAPPRALVVLRTCYLVAQLACATAAGADPHVDDVDEVVLRAVTLAFADEIQALQQAIQVWLS